MNKLLRIKHKLWLLVALALVAVMGIGFAMLSAGRQSMLEDRQAKVLSVTELGLSVVEHYGKLADSGGLTKEEAQGRAKAALKDLRYDTDNYFSVYDPSYHMVLHPIKPELIGKDLADLKDRNGVRLVVEMVDAAKSGQVKFVSYLWPKPGSEKPVRKVAVAKQYAPWGWIVSTGLYVDDLDAIFMQRATWLAGACALGAVLLLVAAFVIVNSITQPLEQMRLAMQGIADTGDLTRRVALRGNRELAEIAQTFNALIARLQQLLGNVSLATNHVATTTDQLVSSSQSVEKSSAAQHRASASVSAAIEEMSTSIDQVADNVSDTVKVTRELRELAADGREAVSQSAQEMSKIASEVDQSAVAVQGVGQRSLQISEIVGVIREIADQTNLLALNAAIEAARAGESGRGFAVVADEVRKLAERTGQSTREISQMIGLIQQDTQSVVAQIGEVSTRARQGAELARQADEVVEKLDGHSAHVSPLVNEIASAAKEQSQATQNIARNVEDISAMAENNARDVTSTAESVRQLQAMVAELRRGVAQFTV